MSTAQLSTQSAPQSVTERRSAEAELRTLIAKFAPAAAPARQRLVGAVRRSLQKRLPTAQEIVYEYRDCFVVSYSPSERGYEGVLAIRGSADGVRLYFNQGEGLPDPEKLLQGSANARWIPVEGASTLARPAVASLIDEAVARNRVPFARTGRGPVVIRSAAAKPRGTKQSVPTSLGPSNGEPSSLGGVGPPDTESPLILKTKIG
jgi:hypothetical protein